MSIEKRPGFVSGWLHDLKDDVDTYGVHKLVPVWVLLAGGLGGGIAYLYPVDFWASRSDVLAFYGAVSTFNGLLLALAWSSFSKIYDIIAGEGFAGYLDDKGLLDGFHWIVDYIHWTQIVAVTLSLGALLSAAMNLPLGIVAQKGALGVTIASTAYALKYAMGSVTLMQDLIYYRTKFDKAKSQIPSGNIVTFGNGRNG